MIAAISSDLSNKRYLCRRRDWRCVCRLLRPISMSRVSSPAVVTLLAYEKMVVTRNKLAHCKGGWTACWQPQGGRKSERKRRGGLWSWSKLFQHTGPHSAGVSVFWHFITKIFYKCCDWSLILRYIFDALTLIHWHHLSVFELLNHIAYLVASFSVLVPHRSDGQFVMFLVTLEREKKHVIT